MALNDKQIAVDLKSLKDNLKQAINILEDLDLAERPDVTLATVGTFAAQASKEAFILMGVMKEKI